MRLRFAIAIISFSTLCFGAISANTAWEVRTTGADTQGGGFVAGATGTDLSQFDNKNAAACTSCQSATVNISTTDAVANGTTTITSATGNFSAAIVGNIVEFSGGTGSIAAVWRQVTVFTNSTTVTIDASIAASTGMTMNIGGALATIGKALAIAPASNIIFVKATATYAITANLALLNNITPTNSTPPNQLVGYTSTRTDQGRATIQLSTNTGLKAIDGSAAGGWFISNFVIDCNGLGTSIGVYNGGNYVALRNLLVKNCTSIGVDMLAVDGVIINSEVTACSGSEAVNLGSTGNSLIQSYIHDNTTVGVFSATTTAVIEFNVIANNSGASSDGITANTGTIILNNTIYNNGRDGIHFGSNIGDGSFVRNNLLISNGAYGLNGALVSWGKFPQWDGNAYFSNATAARNDVDDTGTTNPINAANPYTNTLDVTLTASPFTNTATHDFTLNSTAGGGAAANGAGTPGALPGLTQSGAISFGALQPSASSGGSSTGGVFAQYLGVCAPK